MNGLQIASFTSPNSAFKRFVRRAPTPPKDLVVGLEKAQAISLLTDTSKSPKNDIVPLKKEKKKVDKKSGRKEEVKMGRWTEAEHKLFLEAMETYGNSWEKVRLHIGTRTTAQIRSHAQKYYTGLRMKAIKKYKENPDAEKAIFVVTREYINTSTFK
eukprot:TRINITY_DN9470_c0_g1_i10.p1 TRINITY_DN9470_c0_g1~~TRINITY_DN9470_c0_g1_i10.p1  ORF type:complete len:157 (+),score=31.19 TRINITY_DN9470_c0_g1_i10:141-611(+)